MGESIAAALWGAFGAAVGIGIAYGALKDGLRAHEPTGFWRQLRMSRRRQAFAALGALLLIGCSVASGPLVSWVFATTLVLIIALAAAATCLALRT